jgi:hypothetical protein
MLFYASWWWSRSGVPQDLHIDQVTNMPIWMFDLMVNSEIPQDLCWTAYVPFHGCDFAVTALLSGYIEMKILQVEHFLDAEVDCAKHEIDLFGSDVAHNCWKYKN